MKFRITGTLDELRRVRALLGEAFDVREASEPYPNRCDSTLYRLYVDADLPPARPATRTADNDGRADPDLTDQKDATGRDRAATGSRARGGRVDVAGHGA